MSEELKPCPFCGGTGRVEESQAGFGDYFMADCSECEAILARNHNNKADAIAAWNTSTPSVEGLVEALELAEDVLSRSPFSNHMWPNGLHPQEGVSKIRAALAQYRKTATLKA